MKTLKKYEDLIRNTVNKMNEDDPNWDWSIESFDDYKVLIRWGYLDYLEEKDNCFIIRLIKGDDEGELFMTSRTPQDEMIDGYFPSDEDHSWSDKWESAVKSALDDIAYVAHNKY